MANAALGTNTTIERRQSARCGHSTLEVCGRGADPESSYDPQHFAGRQCMIRPLNSIVLAIALLSANASYAQHSGAEFTRFAGLSLGAGTLTDIRSRLGEAQLVVTGEAGEYEASVCYSSKKGFVAFLAGELDGPEHGLGGFWLSTAPSRPPCGVWPNNIRFPRLSLGPLHLGMTLADFKRHVGAPIRWVNYWAYADFQSRRNFTATEIDRLPAEVRQAIADGSTQVYLDVVVTIEARFRAGVLADLRVWETETN